MADRKRIGAPLEKDSGLDTAKQIISGSKTIRKDSNQENQTSVLEDSQQDDLLEKQTIELPLGLHHQMKIIAVTQDKRLRDVYREAIEHYLNEQS